MPVLGSLAIAGSAGGILVTGLLAAMFLIDPAKGMAWATHRVANLPRVMTDRYVAFTLLAIGATLYRDMNVIAFLFAVFAFIGLADAWIYARDRAPYSKHLMAGVAAALVAAVAVAAMIFQPGAEA